MSAIPVAASIHGIPPSELWESHTAHFAAHWGRSGAVIAVTGELDAVNIGEFAEWVRSCAAHSEWLVLNLNDLEFIATAGYAVLQAINTQCLAHDVHWALVPGAATSRLLRICDPVAALPTAESVDVALSRVAGFWATAIAHAPALTG